MYIYIYTHRYIYNKYIYIVVYIYICIYICIYIAAFLFCNAAVSLPVVLKSICGADECHQIFSGADEYQWC